MRPRRHEYRNLEVPKFDGKNFQSCKVAFLRCAKMMQWSESQTQLVLLRGRSEERRYVTGARHAGC